MLSHNVPIYYANLFVQKYKVNKNRTTTDTDLIVIDRIVIKGFHVNQMKESLKQKIKSKFKLSEEFRITKIELIIQLGFGVDDL